MKIISRGSVGGDAVVTQCTAGTAFASALLDSALDLGLVREQVLAHAGLSPNALDELLKQANGRMPMADLLRLCESVQALSQHPALGVALSAHIRPATFSVLGYALMTCRTLGEAIALIPHYRQLVFDVGYSDTRFSEDGNQARLVWRVLPDTGLPYSAVLAETLLASWCAFGRWMAGRELALQQVRFAHPARSSASADAYRLFFSSEVVFGADQNELVFGHEQLEQRLVQADVTLHLAMREQARAALGRVGTGAAATVPPQLPQQLRQALVSLMPKCEATLEHAAHLLAIAPRSLQRRLEQSGVSFQQILDDVRRELACVYLKDRSMSMLDCALLLGYAEQSSFSRAFSSWFGETPRAWRKRHA